MKRILRSKAALVTAVGTPVVGVAIACVLAGCASTTSSSAASSQYADGTYSANGSYSSPDGQEEIGVTVTVKNNLITAVSVTTVSANGEGERYQQLFESGISSVAVGQSLASLNVSAVAGASLTSAGFNTALESIRSQAA